MFLFPFISQLASPLQTVSSSHNILCKLILQILTPPPPSLDHAHINQHAAEPPSTPIGRTRPVVPMDDHPSPYRINLRFLGSYYTIGYSLLIIALLWVSSAPPLLIILVSILLMCFYCVMKYMVKRTA